MSAFKDMYDRGMVGIVQGIGYPNSNRSHFRGMDIWHTCEPDKVETIGWVGRTLKELDPDGETLWRASTSASDSPARWLCPESR